jgi:hypothetical protein
MRIVRGLGGLVVVLALAGCGDREPPLSPAEPDMRELGGGSPLTQALIAGTAHHTRTIGTVTARTIFAFSGSRLANGDTHGSYHYDFQAAGFSVQGPVSCISIAGNQAWVGGTVARITSPDPEDQSLVGADMWWRSVDNGSGAHGTPDSTTGVGFAFPGGTITAESWCRDQPQALVLREVEDGNLEVKGR